MIHAALGLLDIICSDLTLLGDEILVRDNPALSLSDVPSGTWADIIRMRGRTHSHPFLRDDIERVIARTNGDSLALLSLIAADEDSLEGMGTTYYGFPVGALFTFDRPNRITLGVQVADSHLHSGGSMPADLFIAAVTVRSAEIPSETKDPSTGKISVLELYGATGRRWFVPPILAGLRFLIRLSQYLDYYGEWPPGLDVNDFSDEWLDRVREGTFWLDIRELCLDQELFKQHDGLSLNRKMSRIGTPDSLMQHLEFIRNTQFIPQSSKSSLILGFLRCIVAVHAMLTSRAGEGLTRFSERFAMLGDAKKVAKDPGIANIKTKLLSATIGKLAPTREVVGLEFRSTIGRSDMGSFLSEVKADLAEHCDAFSQSLDGRPSALALSMPVGFRRMHTSSRDPAESAMKELKHVVAGVNSLVSLAGLANGDQIIEAIWSIDVADDELGSNNWPYCVAAGLLRQSGLDLRFTIHAGESFSTPLNGVRRVGELFLGEVVPNRIGHALSLSERLSSALFERSKPPLVASEAVMDLAWLALTELAERDAVESVLHQLLIPSNNGDILAVADVIDGFSLLHNTQFVKDHYLAQVDRLYALRPLEERLPSKPSGSGVLNAAYILSGSTNGEVDYHLNRVLGSAEVKLYSDLASAALTSARNHVIELIKSNGTVIESCPTSNLLLSGASGGHSEHPALVWSAERDCLVSISSDDPFLFAVTVLDEFQSLKKAGVSPDVMRRLAQTSVDACSGGSPRRMWSATDFEKISQAVGNKNLTI